MATQSGLILITGATGYIGGRLARAFAAEGASLRCTARRPEFLRSRMDPAVEVVRADVLDVASLSGALEGVDTAYYLVHSMADHGDFAAQERRGARNFAAAARAAGIRRIVYLGGLGGDGELSDHLASRKEVGEILRSSGVPTIEFRASIIIGSGSLSFDMIRLLVGRLPVMIVPRWVRTAAQPIAVEDVIAYLMAARDVEIVESVVVEIGGAEKASYLDIMREYARQRGLGRIMIPVPFLTPRLSSLWLSLVTPVYARVGRKLVEGLRNETVVTNDTAARLFAIRPRGLTEAIARALRNEDHEFAETRWSDALSSSGAAGRMAGANLGSRIVDSRAITVKVPPEEAFKPVRRIGGETGWYYGTWLWRIRGFLDLLAGGPGMRRGRRDPEFAVPGDALDFWRVEE
ncbi:MAG: DUF2867 domain-containing protein, partial [Bryobacteraceae bacterium]|nr:DUF2867 domain-containing protein [Bryobacteraceae bacterium]